MLDLEPAGHGGGHDDAHHDGRLGDEATEGNCSKRGERACDHCQPQHCRPIGLAITLATVLGTVPHIHTHFDAAGPQLVHSSADFL